MPHALDTSSTASNASTTLDAEKKIVLQKIGQMSNLPTPGASIMKVMLLLRDEDVSMRDLIDSISKDQSLVARILKLINSGYYGLRKTIDTVDRAINLLGILKVKQVVYSASIMDVFSKDEEKEWDHAYSSSVLMSSIMEEHEIPAASNLPMTILMHDIGKVVLRRFMPKKYHMAVDMAEQERLPVHVLEDRLIHLNHAEAGSWLLEKWQMTEDIYIPVMNHHSKEVPQDFVLETALLQFVNWVDCSARNIPCPAPTSELMKEAGFEEIDVDYWINFQRGLISEIESKNAPPEQHPPVPEARPRVRTEQAPDTTSVVLPDDGKTSTERINRKIATQQAAQQAEESNLERKASTEKISRKEVFAGMGDGKKNQPPPLPKKKSIFKRIFGF